MAYFSDFHEMQGSRMPGWVSALKERTDHTGTLTHEAQMATGQNNDVTTPSVTPSQAR